MSKNVVEQEKHIFSIYIPDLSQFIFDQDVKIVDKAIYSRIVNVLRIKAEEQVVLFDDKINIKVQISIKTFETKKSIYAKMLEKHKNKSLFPEIIFCPAVLKKSNFEQILYVSAQMGVNIIQPLITQKSSKKNLIPFDRCKKIMISACEQSKNFVLPELKQPVILEDFLKNKFKNKSDIKIKKVFFEENQNNLFDLCDELNKEKFEKIFILIGPEGGFVDSEINLLKENWLEGYCLTPTILRSIEAATLSLGLTRSLTG